MFFTKFLLAVSCLVGIISAKPSLASAVDAFDSEQRWGTEKNNYWESLIQVPLGSINSPPTCLQRKSCSALLTVAQHRRGVLPSRFAYFLAPPGNMTLRSRWPTMATFNLHKY
jgi:hypothetical protein